MAKLKTTDELDYNCYIGLVAAEQRSDDLCLVWALESTNWPLIVVILFSWGIAFFEYMLMVPANRIGFAENGGPFSLIQLKVIQEVVTLTVFTVFVTVFFKNEHLHWNHFVSFIMLVFAVYFAFMKVD